MKAIVFIGLAGAGKSTCAKILADLIQSETGKVYPIYSFATNAKNDFCRYINKPYEEVFGSVQSKSKYREKIVAFAEGMKVLISPDVWARTLVKQIKSAPSDFIIDDARFNVEPETLVELTTDIVYIKVERDCVVPKATADWYRSGSRNNALTLEQKYQMANITGPNELAYSQSVSSMHYTIDNNYKTHDDLRKDLKEFLEYEKIIQPQLIKTDV
jgi:ABC-type oligopeptide transport system ATPase subunit